MILSAREIALCVAALECSINELTNGIDLAEKHNIVDDKGMSETLRLMRALRDKLMQAHGVAA